MARYLQCRNGHFYYVRRVPEYLRKYDLRRRVETALNTRDPVEAARRAVIHNEIVEKFWANAVKAPGTAQEAAYKDAVAAARVRGFAYKTVEELSSEAIEEIVERVLASAGQIPDVRKAVAGFVNKPGVMLSTAIEPFFTLTKDRLVGKSAIAARRWEHDRRRAVDNFIEAVKGDREVGRISRRDMLDYRKWWVERVANDGVRPDTANKDFLNLKDVLAVIAQDAQLELDIKALFEDLALKAQKKSRASYDASFVQKDILASGVLDSMNEDAQAIVYIMADSGIRPVEIVGLLPEDIFLKAPIPHVWIRPNKRRALKTPNSERQVPLVGYALKGVKMIAEAGITRYESADSASAAINKFFDEKKLKPTEKHTLYSLRHTFKDRLRDAGAPEEVIDNLMGHASKGPKYGRGHILETKVKWMKKIAFKV